MNPDNHLPPSILSKLDKSIVENNRPAVPGGPGNSAGKNPKVEIAGAIFDVSSSVSLVKTFADSGATSHGLYLETAFIPGTPQSCGTRTVVLADQRNMVCKRSGNVLLPFEDVNLRLSDVPFVPQLGYNLVSTGILAEKTISSYFCSDNVRLVPGPRDLIIGVANRDNVSSLYLLPNPMSQVVPQLAMSATTEMQTQLWHRCLAHVNILELQNVRKYADRVPKLFPSNEICRAWKLGKAQKLPFTGHFKLYRNVGKIFHSDIVGPLELSFPDRFQYVSTFVDDHSRNLFVGLMDTRGDV